MKIYHFTLLAIALFLSLGSRTSVAQDKDIVDTAVAAGSFQTLAAALGAADLVDTLKGDGPFTVFAPTDEAFARLPDGTVESLLKPENKDKLVDILTYHVVVGKIPASVAVTLNQAAPLNKKLISLQIRGGSLFLNESKVVQTDIDCSNGVIHVIDQVLMPPATDAPTPPRTVTVTGAKSKPKPRQTATVSQSAQNLAAHALHKGGNQYNHHNIHATETIYKDAVHQLLAMDGGAVSSQLRQQLKAAADKAAHSHHAGRNAWTYCQVLRKVAGQHH